MALMSERLAGNARLQAASENSPPMRKGERGEAVSILQSALIDQGQAMPITTKNGTASPDGIYGDETVRAVWKFQANHNLQRDGVAGRDTLGTLDSLYADKPLNERAERMRAQWYARWRTAY